MKDITIVVQDDYDITLLINALNTLQHIGRRELLVNQTSNEKIEKIWSKETQEEFFRLQTIKEQLRAQQSKEE
jgi:hypothetical protein